ncbi:MAG: MoaD/ThiS family protein [Candidatus Thorarchaeota archaeon]|nr:MoaD/ThiS family protein [Candidatus Thorarchaeota archaeon]
MIEIHLYGLLRRIVPYSSASDDTILTIGPVEKEVLHQLIERIGLDISALGDCFINGRLALFSDEIKSGDRVGLFPFNMRLIDSGMELKYSPHKR